MNDNGILEIRGGDISCIFDMTHNCFIVYVSRYGEMSHYKSTDWDELVDFLKDCYFFDDEMILKFRDIVKFVHT